MQLQGFSMAENKHINSVYLRCCSLVMVSLSSLKMERSFTVLLVCLVNKGEGISQRFSVSLQTGYVLCPP